MLQGTKHFQTEQKTPALQSAESEILTEIFAYVLANFIKTQKRKSIHKTQHPHSGVLPRTASTLPAPHTARYGGGKQKSNNAAEKKKKKKK